MDRDILKIFSCTVYMTLSKRQEDRSLCGKIISGKEIAWFIANKCIAASRNEKAILLNG